MIVVWQFLQPVFRRYLRPEKEYLSFSLLYNNGDRSLDLVGASNQLILIFFSHFMFGFVITLNSVIII